MQKTCAESAETIIRINLEQGLVLQGPSFSSIPVSAGNQDLNKLVNSYAHLIFARIRSGVNDLNSFISPRFLTP